MAKISHLDKKKSCWEAVGKQGAGELQAHYHQVLQEGLSAGAINTFSGALKQLMDGQAIQPVVKQTSKDCLGCLESISQIRIATRGKNYKTGQGTQEKQPRKPFQKWMKERAIKKGNYLRFQRLFYLDRGKLARILLDDMECLSCDISASEIHSVFKSRRENTW